MENKKILVHMCCAPCTSASGEKLFLQGYEVVLFFCNSNIYPKEEYLRRLESAYKLAKIWDVIIEEETYDHDDWLKTIKGFENEAEKGKRCSKCFEYSLKRSAELADRLDIPAFTTTLTVSPHKVSNIIFEIGSQFEKFMPINFKKENGFLRSLELSDEMELYRQNYCGCEFSIRK